MVTEPVALCVSLQCGVQIGTASVHRTVHRSATAHTSARCVRYGRTSAWLSLLWLALLGSFAVQAKPLVFNAVHDLEKLNGQRISDVVQDAEGFIWMSTQEGVFRFDGHEFVPLQELVSVTGSQRLVNVTGMHQSADGRLHMFTRENGVFVYDRSTVSPALSQISILNDTRTRVVEMIENADRTVLVTNRHVIVLREEAVRQYAIPLFDSTEGLLVKNAVWTGADRLLIVTKQFLIEFDPRLEQFSRVHFSGTEAQPFLREVYLDPEQRLWLATDRGVYLQEEVGAPWQQFLPERINVIIKTVRFSNGRLWLGTASHGLYEYDFAADRLSIHSAGAQASDLKYKGLHRLFVDRDGQLWVMAFDGSMQITQPQYRSMREDLSCASSNLITAITSHRGDVLVLTNQGLVRLRYGANECEFYSTTEQLQVYPIGLFVDARQRVLMIGVDGIYTWNADSGAFSTTPLVKTRASVYVVKQLSPNVLLLGGIDRLQRLDMRSGALEPVNTEEPFIDTNFYAQATLGRRMYLATNKGLMAYHLDQHTLVSEDWVNNRLLSRELKNLIEHNGRLYFSVQNDGLYVLSPESRQLEKMDSHGLKTHNVMNMVVDANGVMWMTNNTDLLAVNLHNGEFRQFSQQHGVPPHPAYLNTAHLSASGDVYMGTSDGLYRVEPNLFQRTTPLHPPRLTQLRRFNEVVRAGESRNGFALADSIARINNLQLSHRDYVIGFDFSALDFLQADDVEYRHRLNGFDPDWILSGADHRRISYSNLPSGDYTLQIQARAPGGAFNATTESSLRIEVLPAPWLTWWAKTGYVLGAFLLVSLYIRHKTLASRRLAELLRSEVDEKTRELQVQKQTVERLLDKKNELFAHVSHEFKTPLTLILGPLTELIERGAAAQDVSQLRLVHRNAGRLLSLVEQLLQLARLSDPQRVMRRVQASASQVASVVASFQHMAQNKGVHLSLSENQEGMIDVTDQCIDAVLGNLVSNAIKYTPSGGHVEVASQRVDGRLQLRVSDTGSGLTPEQQQQIFERFHRLQVHQDIEGVGIGLSVVEEMVRVNRGELLVFSEPGTGSEFTVSFALCSEEERRGETQHRPGTLVQQLSQPELTLAATDALPAPETGEDEQGEDGNLVLVIEDNLEMRRFVQGVIQTQHRCITAANGSDGLKVAVQHIPDLIVCDVMMPGMDGFAVSRAIRSDDRTCHIPLILLTALGDKTSRIKGWRENVDAYMTKPFDREELLVQIDNMLAIRDLLKQRAGEVLDHPTANQASHALCERDQQFIDRLMQFFAAHHGDCLLKKTHIAQGMAVSERQLQRKLKALIDKNPMDMLREYRLQNAAELLRGGHRVSEVSDRCGFNSLSYFSQCFKARFGVSPKSWQQDVLGHDG